MTAHSGVIDWLRLYTAPRGTLVALLFIAAVLLRLPAVVLAVGVHVLEQITNRLLDWLRAIPAQPQRRYSCRRADRPGGVR